ncbi:hypothetical protein GCM10025867_25920 [Frondihabitans sucicola]|uniref:Glycosyl hydrolases family 2 sugar binding domain-containing protein n=1 Tax=Frondihabitans sucicola TaxID=1268041 RepID=A0ABM8GPG5_9MICO|nr:hypothetical protein GCM10025867_25920 [Frondihabitans sucicola]
MTTAIPRPDYPRPQFTREQWLNLNGQWQFEFDPGDSGFERGLSDGGRALGREITVPFAPESDLSGIGDVDFHNAVWYRREVTVPGSGPAGSCCTSARSTTTPRSGSTGAKSGATAADSRASRSTSPPRPGSAPATPSS